MNNFPSTYEIKNNIYFPIPGEMDTVPFNYSDGEEFEQTIKNIIASASDRTLFSQKLRSAIWDWRSSCHLSPVRANILRPLEAICRGRVLELGSGCGIITRYLGELGGEVVALEASPFRAEVTKLRTEELDNVSVVCDRIEDFNSESKFDVVTMIGVLQYARLFSTCGDKAELSLINNAARQLDTDGVLVIAIQNKLGLKYFSGYPEANVGLPYVGIENNYGPETIIRFGLDELKGILASAGLGHQAVLFPFPDYHMPVSILNEKAVKPNVPFRASPLLSVSAARDRVRSDWVNPQFSLECALDSVHSAGATAHLSNAFLIIAGKTEKALAFQRMMPEFAWHYSVDRHVSFAIEKRFVEMSDNNILVSSSLVQKTTKLDGLPITHHIHNETYIDGCLWWQFLIGIVNRPGWSVMEVANWTKPWLAILQPKKEIEDYDLNEMLSGDLFDCTPLNCIQALDGSLIFIDREWELHSEISYASLILRGLFGSLLSVSSCASPAPGTPIVIIELIKEVLKTLNLFLTDEHIKEYVIQEACIQGWIRTGETCDSLGDVYGISLNCRISSASVQLQYIQQNALLEHQRGVNAELQATISHYQKFLPFHFIRALGCVFSKLRKKWSNVTVTIPSIKNRSFEQSCLKSPRVSVIIPTYNRALFIRETIESVLTQTFSDFELIVIDDGSTDDTAEIVKMIRDVRLIYIYQINQGRSNARNHALRIAKGSYITFLDSDDVYLENKLAMQVAYLDNNVHVDMLYTSASCMNDAGEKIEHKYEATVSGHIYNEIAFFVPVTITLPTVMVRRTVFDVVGDFDENMHRFEDTDMWRRISKVYYIGALKEYTCKLRTHEDNSLLSQDPKQILLALDYYANKILSEDRKFGIVALRKGLANMYMYYALAILSVSKWRNIGIKLFWVSVRFWPFPYIALKLRLLSLKLRLLSLKLRLLSLKTHIVRKIKNKIRSIHEPLS